MKGQIKNVICGMILLGEFCACSSPTVSPEEDSPVSANSSSSVAVVTSSSSVFSSSSAFILSSSSASLSAIYEGVEISGLYTTRDSVAAYLCKFGALPKIYVDKDSAQTLYELSGKSFSKWNFNPYQELGVMVGGDSFGNAEGMLPGENYRECDVDYSGENRGTRRLVYGDSCEIYFTADHYETFERLEF